jgi:23S rRNA (cytosine1962-C5)-methyltransferase
MSSPSEQPEWGAIRYRLRLKEGRDRSVQNHHPWVFDGAVEAVERLEGAEPGEVGDIFDSGGAFVARGTVHPDSQIICRILTWEDRPIDVAFFEEKIRAAVEARAGLIDRETTSAWRVVNAEGDELPGLVVDRYGEIAVVQTLTSGMLRLRPLWLEALRKVLQPLAILERGDRARRESLPTAGPVQTLLWGSAPSEPWEVKENGLRFLVDLEGGQKTGFYLDQRENRAAVRRYAQGRDVLNLFGYTGSFSVYAAAGGARHVVQVETSVLARELSRQNWGMNDLDPGRLEMSGDEVAHFLRRDARTFDLLVLDPPPFAKDRGSVDRAARAYKDINLWAFCRSRPGALIWSFSCSQHMGAELFQKVVFGAAHDVGAEVHWLARLGAAPDHPVHLNHPQGEYLKGLLMRVLRPGTPPRKIEAHGSARE